MPRYSGHGNKQEVKLTALERCFSDDSERTNAHHVLHLNLDQILGEGCQVLDDIQLRAAVDTLEKISHDSAERVCILDPFTAFLTPSRLEC